MRARFLNEPEDRQKYFNRRFYCGWYSNLSTDKNPVRGCVLMDKNKVKSSVNEFSDRFHPPLEEDDDIYHTHANRLPTIIITGTIRVIFNNCDLNGKM